MLRSRVPADAAGSSLLTYLCQRFPYHARERWQQEIDAQRIFVAGRPATAATTLRAGEELAYHKSHREPWVDDAIAVLHDDADLLVVDKPAHLPMHADGPFVRATLVHLLRQRQPAQTLHLVHRLDRETSGVCVLARSPRARAALHAQFEAGEVGKTYLAVVRGTVPDDFAVDAPIGHSRTSRIALRRAAGEAAQDGKPALTRFRVRERGPGATLLECEPHTGRTHQIRVHLEHAGFPILGDKLYGQPDDAYLAFVAAVKRTGDARGLAGTGPERQLLHAHTLTLRHPANDQRTTWQAAMPAEFSRWLRAADG